MSASHPLAALLARWLDLTAAERQAVEAVPVRRAEAAADEPILRQGDRPTRCLIVLAGLLCRSKLVSTGERQIVAFHVPGDMPDLHGLHLPVFDSDMWAVAPSALAFVEHAPLRRLCEEFPRIAAALWRTTLVDASIGREWTVSVGQRPAVGRLAHLFCEVLMRMEAAGLAEAPSGAPPGAPPGRLSGASSGGACAFPVTQGDLSEATGLSVVHLNRTLQELRQAGLVSFDAGRLVVRDWEGLAERGDFTPDYLHLEQQSRRPPEPWARQAVDPRGLSGPLAADRRT